MDRFFKKAALFTAGVAMAAGAGVFLASNHSVIEAKATDLEPGSYTATLDYSNPIPTSIDVVANETVYDTLTVSSTGITYSDEYSEYVLAKSGGGVITVTNSTNAVFTKIILDIYNYDNYTVTCDGVDAHVGLNTNLGNHGKVDIDLEGSTTVTITTNNKYTAKLFGFTIYLKAGSEVTHVNGVTLNAESGFVFIDNSRQLTANVTPMDADDRTVTWSSSDKSVAVVDTNGLVTGVAAGTAIITATTNDGGFEASFAATVKELSYGTTSDPLSVEEACDVIEITGTSASAEKLTIIGNVSSASYNSTNKNYLIWLSNTAGTIDQFFECYRTEFDSSVLADYTDGDSLVGKQIIVTGYGKIYGAIHELSYENSTAPVVKTVIYNAEQFSSAVLVQTNDICQAYTDESTYALQKAALKAIWPDLEQMFDTISEEGKAALAAATADEGGTLLEQAMARYDYVVAKYELDNFISARVISSARGVYNHVVENNSSMVLTVVSLVMIGVLAAGSLVLVRKKRHI